MKQAICPCGNSFIKEFPNQKYCSEECARNFRKEYMRDLMKKIRTDREEIKGEYAESWHEAGGVIKDIVKAIRKAQAKVISQLAVEILMNTQSNKEYLFNCAVEVAKAVAELHNFELSDATIEELKQKFLQNSVSNLAISGFQTKTANRKNNFVSNLVENVFQTKTANTNFDFLGQEEVKEKEKKKRTKKRKEKETDYIKENTENINSIRRENINTNTNNNTDNQSVIPIVKCNTDSINMNSVLNSVSLNSEDVKNFLNSIGYKFYVNKSIELFSYGLSLRKGEIKDLSILPLKHLATLWETGYISPYLEEVKSEDKVYNCVGCGKELYEYQVIFQKEDDVEYAYCIQCAKKKKEDYTEKLEYIKMRWNEFARKWKIPEIKEIKKGSTREKHVIARLKEGLDIDELLKKVEEQRFLLGENKAGWIATFDWLMYPSNYIKVLEGSYKGLTEEERIARGWERLDEYIRSVEAKEKGEAKS